MLDNLFQCLTTLISFYCCFCFASFGLFCFFWLLLCFVYLFLFGHFIFSCQNFPFCNLKPLPLICSQGTREKSLIPLSVYVIFRKWKTYDFPLLCQDCLHGPQIQYSQLLLGYVTPLGFVKYLFQSLSSRKLQSCFSESCCIVLLRTEVSLWDCRIWTWIRDGQRKKGRSLELSMKLILLNWWY